MPSKFEFHGNYLDGVDQKKYTFGGDLTFLGGPVKFPFAGNLSVVYFVGLVDDGRCPAEILDGKIAGDHMMFLKKYRYDDTILKHPFFKDKNFSSPRMANHICDDWPGILYYGKLERGEKSVCVSGIYNSAGINKENSFEELPTIGLDLFTAIQYYSHKTTIAEHDEIIQKLVFNEYDPRFEKMMETNGIAAGKWDMNILFPAGVPKYMC